MASLKLCTAGRLNARDYITPNEAMRSWHNTLNLLFISHKGQSHITKLALQQLMVYFVYWIQQFMVYFVYWNTIVSRLFGRCVETVLMHVLYASFRVSIDHKLGVICYLNQQM